MLVKIGPYPKSPKAKRKVSIKVDKFDVWSLHHTLAMIILPCLKLLQASKHGSPYTADEDVPEKLKSVNAKPKKNEWDTDSNWHKRWDYIVKEMVWSFEQLAKDGDLTDAFHHGKTDIKWEPCEYDKKGKPTLYTMEKGPKDTYTFDTEGYEKHYARVQNGLRLFGVYYGDLWT